MPEPISFRIVQNLQAAVRGISVAGGYHNDVAAIAVKLDPNSAVEAVKAPGGPRPLVLLRIHPERWKYDPANQLKLVLPVTANWVQESDATDDDSRMKVFYRGCADIEQAITQDLGRGGFAADTRVVAQTFNDDIDGSQVWGQIEIEVQFHRTYGQPNA